MMQCFNMQRHKGWRYDKVKIKKNKEVIEKDIKREDLSAVTKFILTLITTLLSVSMLIPLLLTIAVSFTENETLMLEGYKLWPSKWSLSAYEYLFKTGGQIWQSYGVSICVTIIGTLFGLSIMTLFAYAITRKSFPWKRQFILFIYFTMLFNGGLVPTYIMYSNILHLRDSALALILPLCINGTYILILRTYMRTSIPDSIEEAAKIDGAGDFLSFYKIILPMCVPVIATIALFLAVAYWNDWYQAFLYIVENDKMVPIQLLLKRIENEIQYLSNAASTGMSGVEIQNLNDSLPEESVKMALVVLVTIPIMVAYPFFQKYFVNGITIGSVKE